jgi:hypothetical protein
LRSIPEVQNLDEERMIDPEEERKSLSSLDINDVNEGTFSADEDDSPMINTPKLKNFNQNYEVMS